MRVPHLWQTAHTFELSWVLKKFAPNLKAACYKASAGRLIFPRLRSTLLPRLLALAEARDIEIEEGVIQELKRQWKTELKQLKGWFHVRNHVAGHYDQDVKKQVGALESVKLDEVMSVTAGFLQFAQCLILIRRGAGRGEVDDDRELTDLKAQERPRPKA